MGRDAVLGCVTLALSAAYFWMAAAVPVSQLADAIGPRGLPRAYAVLLALLSLALVARGLARRQPRTTPARPTAAERDARPSGPGAPHADARSRLWRAAGMLGIGLVYLAVVPWLGYAVSIAALILATIYYQGGAVGRASAVVAIAGGVFFWFLFVALMGIAQPPGLLPLPPW